MLNVMAFQYLADYYRSFWAYMQTNDPRAIEEPKMTSKSFWRQCSVISMCGLTFVIAGFQYSWVGLTYVIFETHEVFSLITNLSRVQQAWLSSALQLASFIATFFAAFIANRYGRQPALSFIIIPNTVSALLLIFGEAIWLLYVSQFIGVVGISVTQTIVPVYVAEVSSPRIRGATETCLVAMLCTGSLLSIILLPFIALKHSNILILSINFCYGVGVFFLPETPYYLMMKGHKELAVASLRKLFAKQNVEFELSQITLGRDRHHLDEISFCCKENKWPLGIFALVLIATISSTAPAIVFRAHIRITSTLILIALMSIYLLSTIASALLVDRFGRRPLFLSSITVCGVCALCLGAYFCCENNFGRQATDRFIALIYIDKAIYLTAIAFGVSCMPYIFVGELFDTKNRGVAGILISVSSTSASIAIQHASVYFSQRERVEYLFLAFGILSIFICAIGIRKLPETKGKTLQQIQGNFHEGCDHGDVSSF